MVVVACRAVGSVHFRLRALKYTMPPTRPVSGSAGIHDIVSYPAPEATQINGLLVGSSDTLAASATLPPQADANLLGSLGGTAGSSGSAVDRGGSVPKRRKGNKSKKLPTLSGKKPSAILDWTESMVRDLMTLRFDTYADRFSSAKNNAALKVTWLLLATDMSERQKTPISTEQCKNKLKWLKRKWAEYKADCRATGNREEEVAEPTGLDLMEQFWASSAGMDGHTLADSEADGGPLLSCDEEEEEEELGKQTSGQKNKKRKTIGDSFEIGMQSIAEGFQAMAAAMAPPQQAEKGMDTAVGDLIDSRFRTMMQRQDEQLVQMQLQNQNLSQLIAALQRRD